MKLSGVKENREVWASVSAVDSAKFFGVAPRTLADWTSRGCPKNSHGKYNLKEVMDWRGTVVSGESSQARKEKAEAKYRESKAELAELQVGEKSGNLISKEEVIQEWSLRVANVKTSLLLLPKKIAGLFPDRRMRQLVEEGVKDVVYNALDQYCRKGEYTPQEKEFPIIEIKEEEESESKLDG